MNRSFVVLIGVAVVLVLLVLLVANPWKDSIRSDNPAPTDLFEPALVDQADRIEIRAPGGDSVALSRVGEGWVVASKGDFPADTTTVSSILRAVKSARASGTVSRNPDNRDKFEVGAAGVEVKVLQGTQSVAHFVVGKVGQDFTTSYVRLADADDVHVVRGLNKQLFARSQGMRDRTLLAFSTDSVSEVVVELPQGGWTLARTDTTWALTPQGGGVVAAQETEVDRLLQSLATLAADGFLDGDADTVETGLETPDYTFLVRLMNGSEVQLVVGGKNEQNQYFVARPDRRVVYLLGEWRLNNLAKKPEDLMVPQGGG